MTIPYTMTGRLKMIVAWFLGKSVSDLVWLPGEGPAGKRSHDG
jgi:hypothetical protein